MTSNKADSGLFSFRITLIFVMLIPFLWAVDAIIDAFLLDKGPFLQTAFNPGFPEIRTRLLFIFAILVSTFTARLLLMDKSRKDKARKEGGKFLQSIINGASEGVFVLDEDFKCQMVNSSGSQMFGYLPPDFTGKSITDMIYWEDLPEVENQLARTAQGSRTRFEVRRKDAKGGFQYLNFNLAPIEWEGQKRIMGLIIDVTERKQTEAALRESEEHFRRIAENAPDIIFRWSFEKGLEYANPIASEITGYSIQELKATLDLKHKSSNENTPGLIRSYFEQITEHDGIKSREISFLRKEGKTATLDFGAVPIKDETGQVIAIEGIARDITNRKKMEAEFKKAASEWRLTFDTISDLIIIVDRDNRITKVNEAASKMFGRPYPEIIGKQCYRIVHNCETPHLFCPHKQTLEDRLEHTIDINYPHLGRDFSLTTSPLQDEHGNLIGTVHLMRDETVPRQMEKELLKSQKLESIGLLAGGIAHDFNNILTVILANLSIAKKEAPQPSDLFESLCDIENASLQAKSLARQLQTFSKGGSPIKKIFNPSGLLKDAVSFALRGSNVKSDFSIAEDLWLIEADEGQINQVINNLIINAIQAMPEGGTVSVRAQNIIWEPSELSAGINLNPGTYIKISVQDRGVGINEENIHKIFDPYFSTKPKGTGLGLATSYSIVKNHSGYIQVESKVGKGTTFHVYLPASPDEDLPEQNARKNAASGKGKILVMDDIDKVRVAVAKILKQFGYEVETANNGEQAIAAYTSARQCGKPFDAVIVDLTIPGGMGGSDAIRRLKEIDPQVKAIIASGYSNNSVMANYKDYGFLDMVVKPFKPEELNDILQRLLMPKI